MDNNKNGAASTLWLKWHASWSLGPGSSTWASWLGGLFVNSMTVWSLLPKLSAIPGEEWEERKALPTAKGGMGVHPQWHMENKPSAAGTASGVDSGAAARESARVHCPEWICVDCPTGVPAWMLNYVLCLSLFSHFPPLYFLSFSIFVHVSRGTIPVLNKGRENMDLFS